MNLWGGNSLLPVGEIPSADDDGCLATSDMIVLYIPLCFIKSMYSTKIAVSTLLATPWCHEFWLEFGYICYIWIYRTFFYKLALAKA